jgi:outer membrane protein OmpA-like peptidoglycan-associated protein
LEVEMNGIVLSLVLVAPLIGYADKPKNVPINVTGTWNANFSGGMDLLLHQDGSVVWGKDNNGYLIRGDWSDGKLTLFYRLDFDGKNHSCSAPAIAIVTSQGTATRLEGTEFLANGGTQIRTLTRASPNPGADFTYPYAAELKVCGSLPAHDLVFDINSDKLRGSEWPLLAAIADTMRKEGGLKIQILGHTDATGDPNKNKDLSQRRADAIKKVLTDKYKADASRISTKGWGQDQPLASNETEDGRSINRRVDILVVP